MLLLSAKNWASNLTGKAYCFYRHKRSMSLFNLCKQINSLRFALN